jgi:hypothetical protein
MLDPDDRHLLVDALKPPVGMSLDVAVGTTFTLDLQALLLAPVSFAFFGFDVNASGGRDPLALLESVRRHADRITMFCQAGCIAVPRTLQPVLAWLEDSVVPVRPPGPGRLFHPRCGCCDSSMTMACERTAARGEPKHDLRYCVGHDRSPRRGAGRNLAV